MYYFLESASRSSCARFVKWMLLCRNSSLWKNSILQSSEVSPLFVNRTAIFSISRLIDCRCFFLISLKQKTSLDQWSPDRYRSVFGPSSLMWSTDRTRMARSVNSWLRRDFIEIYLSPVVISSNGNSGISINRTSYTAEKRIFCIIILSAFPHFTFIVFLRRWNGYWGTSLLSRSFDPSWNTTCLSRRQLSPQKLHL